MNITVYNKTYLFGGFLVGTLGGYLSDTKVIDNIYLTLGITILGIVIMLLSFKKPKETESEEL